MGHSAWGGPDAGPPRRAASRAARGSRVRLVAPVADVVDQITSWGVVSASSNRKSFRVGDESLDHFRRYMGVYAREQAYCHVHPALVRNLEHVWNAK